MGCAWLGIVYNLRLIGSGGEDDGSHYRVGSNKKWGDCTVAGLALLNEKGLEEGGHECSKGAQRRDQGVEEGGIDAVYKGCNECVAVIYQSRD